MTETVFREVQRFRQWWLWLLLLPGALAITGIMAYGMVVQLALGRPWGDEPMSDVGLAIVGSLSIALVLLVVLGLYSMKLVTEVRGDGLYIVFFPLYRRRIAFQDIWQCEPVSYRPLGDYGGWGIRWNPWNGLVYSTSGNTGVRLELVGGRRVLTGSQRAGELAQAIRGRLGR